jgi:hypothetical protein
VLREATGDEGRLTRAFRLCVARGPSAEELSVLREMLDRQRRRFAEAGAKPEELLAGQPEMPKGVAAGEAAAWVAVARVLLNLDETITKE